jgi:alanine racemase
MKHPVIAYIDLSALQNNLTKIKNMVPQSKILAMVKGNAYGHQAVPIARALDGKVEVFGVACLDEAIKLHDAGIKTPIVILKGFFDSDDLAIIQRFNFETVLHNYQQIEILEKTKLMHPLKVWLKIDTGMHRLGFPLAAVQDVYQRLMANNLIVKPLRLMTHFSDADDITKNKTNDQTEKFFATVKGLAGEYCLANSSAILNWEKTRVAWVRPGITLYGVSPVASLSAEKLGLIPVMTLTSRIITIHNLKKGDTVGYGSTWVCPCDMRVGIVDIGYGDGYPRVIKTGAPVLLHGKRCPLIGRVAMDMINLDLRDHPQARVGDEIILWGKGLPIEEVTSFTDTVSYELLCRLTSRVNFQVLN